MLRSALLAATALAFAVLLTACIDTTPTTRIHAAASVPRFVDVNTFSFGEEQAGSSPVGASFGAGYGTAWSDVGNVHGAQIYHAGIHYRTANFAAGWTPYLAYAQVSHEGTGGFGSTLWFAFHWGGGNDWRFSYQNSFTGMSKVAEDKGCKNAGETLFFGSDCAGQAQSATRAEVKIRDVGFNFTAEKHLSGRSSLLLAPSAHWTTVTGSNQLDVDAANNYVRRSSFWSPGVQLGYAMRFGEKLTNTVVLMAGAEYAKSFRPDRVVREWVPSVDVRLQF